MNQYFIPFNSWTFCCVDGAHFLYSLTSWWTFGLFPLRAVVICVDYIAVVLGQYQKVKMLKLLVCVCSLQMTACWALLEYAQIRWLLRAFTLPFWILPQLWGCISPDASGHCCLGRGQSSLLGLWAHPGFAADSWAASFFFPVLTGSHDPPLSGTWIVPASNTWHWGAPSSARHPKHSEEP